MDTWGVCLYIIFLIILVCFDYLINFSNNKELYVIYHIGKKTSMIASLGKLGQMCEGVVMLMNIFVGI